MNTPSPPPQAGKPTPGFPRVLPPRARRKVKKWPPGFPLVRLPEVTVALVPHRPLTASDALCGAIESIRVQTWPHWRLLVWDGGLSVRLRARLMRYERADSRIQRVPAPKPIHFGDVLDYHFADALNYLLGQARGKYFCRQDEEAVSHPERLAHSIAALEAAPEHVGVQSALQVRSFASARSAPILDNSAGGNSAGGEGKDDDVALFFRRKWLQEAGGWLALKDCAQDARVPFMEDVVMAQKLTQLGASCVKLPPHLCVYDSARVAGLRPRTSYDAAFAMMSRHGLAQSYWSMRARKGAKALDAPALWPRLARANLKPPVR